MADPNPITPSSRAPIAVTYEQLNQWQAEHPENWKDFHDHWSAQIKQELVLANRENKRRWASENSLSYRIHALTDPFFKAIFPQTNHGTVVCALSSCLSTVVVVLSAATLPVSTCMLFLNLGLAQIVKKIEKQQN